MKSDLLSSYVLELIDGEKGTALLEKYPILDTSFTPNDVLEGLDKVIVSGVDLEDLKSASNKLFNILFKTLSEREKLTFDEDSLLHFLTQDNLGIKNLLAETRKHIKDINRKVEGPTLTMLIAGFEEMLSFTEHYIAMQNIVFPELEKQVKEHGCLKLMWSFHSDIISNIKSTLKVLKAVEFDLKAFNQLSSKVYFNISTIVFREENVLFPVILDVLSQEILESMLHQLKEFNLAFADYSIRSSDDERGEAASPIGNDFGIQLSTGILSIDQIELIFNNLPVDVTLVDENDEVRFFSSPPHRIFPRTPGIIGRKVQNCHPHESVDVVNRIIESFKNNSKNEASFHIKMGPKYVLIKYFALRDGDNNYKGVLEVSQEISEIQNIKGEKRLLDWE